MKRKTLDYIFSAGGVGIAVLLLVLGLVLTSNANFARDYVTEQLSEQAIAFPPAEALSEEEAASECVTRYAGQTLTTGKMAECYANDFIGLHVKNTADGQTYAQLGGPERELRAQVAEAEAAGAANLEELQAELADVSRTRDTMFKGETLRGVLLTTYGFSEFGEKADQAATVLFVAAGLMLLLSAAGFAHAARTPDEKMFAPAPQLEKLEEEEERQPVGV
jgi:hypothetical protein